MEDFFAKNFEEITRKSVPANNGLNCMIWQGTRKQHSPYGVKKLSPPGHKPIVRTVHRALYMCHVKSLELPTHMDVSHMCHVPLCVNLAHLVLEDHEVNMARLECKNEGKCTKMHEPPCMFTLEVSAIIITTSADNLIFFSFSTSPFPNFSPPRSSLNARSAWILTIRSAGSIRMVSPSLGF